MRRAAIWVVAGVLAAALCGEGSSLAADKKAPDAGGAVFGALGKMALSNSELSQQVARGVVVENSISDGTVRANSVGAGSLTGTIANSNSINNNTGITTVFQNSGNNSLFQSSISISITVH